MKRLFYYSGYRLTVFHWINGKFAGNYYFNPDEVGKEEFRHYLRNTPNVPGRLLVDVIEEDFRVESIPHLYGKDRQAVIKRLNERYFRASKQYTYYEHQGREKTGRKDDRILLSALTNVDMIKPWMNILQEEDVPVCGIWTLPHVSKKVLGRINAKTGHVLLISQQVSSNVRQTYFHNGKLITSRSATINLEDDTYGKFISEEIDQTARFLTNKRFIGFDEVLHVHIIASDQDIESISKECQSTPLREITVHKLAEIEKKVDTQGISGPFGNGIFAQLCMEDRMGVGHYGNSEDFSICTRYRVGKFLQNSAIAMVILSVLYSVYLFIDIERLKTESVIYSKQTAIINENYEYELQRLEPKLKIAQLMRSSVNITRDINKKKQVSPQYFFVELSKSLSGHDLSLIRIQDIQWAVEKKVDEDDDGDMDKTVPVQLKSGTLQHQVTLKGQVPVTADNIRAAVNQVNRFAEVLRARKDVSRVVIEKLPIDVRSTAMLSLETGADAPKELQKSDSGIFTLVITMEGAG